MGNNQSWTWKSDNAEHQTTFLCPELIHNHFQYYHTVDDHNNHWHTPISLEMPWYGLIVCLCSWLWSQRSMFWSFGPTFSTILTLEPLHFEKNSQRNSSTTPTCWKRVLRRLVRIIVLPVGSVTTSVHYHHIWRFKAPKSFRLTPDILRGNAFFVKKCSCYCRCSPGTILCNRCFPNHLLVAVHEMQEWNGIQYLGV